MKADIDAIENDIRSLKAQYRYAEAEDLRRLAIEMGLGY